MPVSNAVITKSTSRISNGKVPLTIHNVSDNETEREFIYNWKVVEKKLKVLHLNCKREGILA